MKGIYKIWINNPNKIYVGSTVVCLNKRRNQHLSSLKSNRHTNPQLQTDFNKYGKAHFNFETHEEIKDSKIVIKRENYWYCEFLRQGHELYNYYSPEQPPMLGRNHSKETKEKMSKAQKGRKHSKETKEKMSKAHKGKKHSEETREKLSELRKNKKHSKEVREKMSKAQVGKKLSKKHKEKISNFNIGGKHSKKSKLKNAISKGAKPFCIMKNGEVIAGYINQSECARDFYLSRQNINACLHNKLKTHKDYTFKYK